MQVSYSDSSSTISTPSTCLEHWLRQQVSPSAFDWLKQRCDNIAAGAPQRVLFTSFSAVPRFTGKQDLELLDADKQSAQVARSGWRPDLWSVDRAGRALLLLSIPHNDLQSYKQSIDQLFGAADVGEQVALYQTLPLLPHPDLLLDRALDGPRTNMTAVFNAIAHYNPFPAEYFSELAWNQLVLKAIFVGTPLHPIQGLDRRANPTLARILYDYVCERRAASREVTPELWRAMGPHLDTDILTELKGVLADSDPRHHEAAALACWHASTKEARALVGDRPELYESLTSNALTWERYTQNHLVAD